MIVTGGQVLEEGVLEGVVGGHIPQLLHGGHALFLQHGEDLVQGHALGNGHLHRLAAGRALAHAADEGAVIHVGIQLIGAGSNLVVPLHMGQRGEELEDQLVLDQAVFLQQIGHLVQGGALLNGDGGIVLRLVEGQHIAGGHPAQSGQQGRDADDKDHIEQRAETALAAFAAGPAAGRPGSGVIVAAARLLQMGRFVLPAALYALSRLSVVFL